MREEIEHLYSELKAFESAIEGISYNFTPPSDFRKIVSLEESQLVYWSEIVQRLHASSATSIFRLIKWIDSALLAYDNNYYSLCSSIRGLIEACGDTFYTLSKVIYPICDNFKEIEIALNGYSSRLMISSEIENELIHFIYARKLDKIQKSSFDSAHNARQVRDYINAIGSQSVTELYAELCQVSHPSALSLIPFILSTDENEFVLHKENVDSILNENLIDRNKNAIEEALRLALVISICGLYVINQFDAEVIQPLKLDEDVFTGFESSEIWETLKLKILTSRGS